MVRVLEVALPDHEGADNEYDEVEEAAGRREEPAQRVRLQPALLVLGRDAVVAEVERVAVVVLVLVVRVVVLAHRLELLGRAALLARRLLLRRVLGRGGRAAFLRARHAAAAAEREALVAEREREQHADERLAHARLDVLVERVGRLDEREHVLHIEDDREPPAERDGAAKVCKPRAR